MNICDYCIHKQTCTNKPLATTKCKDFEAIPKKTVFQRITQSSETLANEFISFDHGLYYSWFVGQYFNTYAEAFAATVAKLNEVEDE